MKKYLLVIGIIVGIVAGIYLSQRVSAAAPNGLPATVATSSPAAVSATASTLFSTSTCSSRIITSRASALMLTFSDYAGQTPTGTFGHLQAASTTVAYDSAIYGCGRVKAYAFTSDTITVTETRE